MAPSAVDLGLALRCECSIEGWPKAEGQKQRIGYRKPPKKSETGMRSNSAGIPYTLRLRIEAIEFPTFGLLLFFVVGFQDFRDIGFQDSRFKASGC